jgi:hypothetical protein
MSIGGAFYALDRYRLRALVIDPATVPGFIRGQGVELDGTGALGCIYLTAAHVERTAARLAQRDVQALMVQFTGEPAKFAELYWAKVWQDGAKELAAFLEGVKRFFAGAAARRDAVVFYLA